MKSKELVIDNITYTIKEPNVGVIFPIMDLMTSDAKKFQMELIRRCVYVNNAPLNDAVNELAISAYIKLGEAVVEIAGFAGEQEGK